MCLTVDDRFRDEWTNYLQILFIPDNFPLTDSLNKVIHICHNSYKFDYIPFS